MTAMRDAFASLEPYCGAQSFPALAFTLLTVAASATVARAEQASVQPSAESRQVCGRAVALHCSDKGGGDIELLMDSRALVSVRIEAADSGESLRTAARGLLFRRVCATGHWTREATAFDTRMLTVSSLRDVAADSGQPYPDWVRPGVARTCDEGVELPTVKKPAKPSYTRAAMAMKIQGTAWIEAVVGVDGKVHETRVLRSIDPDFGLDEEAIKATKKWQFHRLARMAVRYRWS
jgi:TonB family protein